MDAKRRHIPTASSSGLCGWRRLKPRNNQRLLGPALRGAAAQQATWHIRPLTYAIASLNNVTASYGGSLEKRAVVTDSRSQNESALTRE